MKWKIIHNDCLKGLDEINDQSIDFVATDPPYFLDGLDDKWDKSKISKKLKKGVIGGLPAGMKFDKNQGNMLRDFMGEVAIRLYRVLKPGGFVAVFSQPRLSFAIGSALDDAGFEIRDMMIWNYGSGQAKAFSLNHFVDKMDISNEQKDEIRQEISGKKTPQLRPQFEPIFLAQKPKDGTFIDNWMRHKTGLISPEKSLFDDGFPGTIISAKKPKQSTGHITVKPVSVMQHLIRLFSQMGQTVLDPFVGSGTTAVAALKENRDFVGFEINLDYINIAEHRIESEVNG